MADSSQESSAADKGNVWASGFGKEYDIQQPKTKAFMVEDAQWDRIRGRVADLEAKGGIDWLIAASTMVGGIGASAGLGLLALPKATKGQTELAPFVSPALWATFLGGVFLAIVLGRLWVHLKDKEADTASDICAEMNTIQEAWQERADSTAEPQAVPATSPPTSSA